VFFFSSVLLDFPDEFNLVQTPDTLFSPSKYFFTCYRQQNGFFLKFHHLLQKSALILEVLIMLSEEIFDQARSSPDFLIILNLMLE
jgi:hypothetical protein